MYTLFVSLASLNSISKVNCTYQCGSMVDSTHSPSPTCPPPANTITKYLKHWREKLFHVWPDLLSSRQSIGGVVYYCSVCIVSQYPMHIGRNLKKYQLT